MSTPTLAGYTSHLHSASATTRSFTFIVENTDVLVMVFVNAIQASTDPSDRGVAGVTIDGAAATEEISLRTTSTNRRYASGLYELSGLSAGTKTIEVTYSAPFNNHVVYAVEVTGHAPAPILQNAGALNGATATSGLVGVTTTRTDSLWIGCSRTQDGAKTLTPTSGCTEINEKTNSAGLTQAVVASLITRSGAGTYNLGSSWSGGIAGGGLMAVEIAHAPTGLKSFPYFYRQRQ